MHNVMLFGEGWNGEVRDVEEGARNLLYIPNPQDPRFREVAFTIVDYISDNGNMYLVGFHGQEPLMPDVEEAILRNNPRPV